MQYSELSKRKRDKVRYVCEQYMREEPGAEASEIRSAVYHRSGISVALPRKLIEKWREPLGAIPDHTVHNSKKAQLSLQCFFYVHGNDDAPRYKLQAYLRKQGLSMPSKAQIREIRRFWTANAASRAE